MVRIVDEDDGCTRETIQPLVKLINLIGFNLIFTHFGLRTYIRDHELTYDEVKEKGDGFLQRNSMYFFCESSQKETTLKDTFIGELLCLKLTDSKPVIEVSITLEGAEESDGGSLPIQVRKDIIYRDSNTKAEIGWYNVRANVLWLTDIVHFPNRVVPLLKPILEGIREFRDTGFITTVSKLTLGADPEFEIVDSENHLIPAHDLWEGSGEIGCDGHTSTGELRPKPAETPLILVRNIRRLIRRLASHPKIPIDAKIQAGGGMIVTTGGHLHYSLKELTPKMQDTLFSLVGEPVISQMTGIRRESTHTIRKGGSDSVRQNEHGLEWRSLPSWLVSEDICTAVIVVSYCIIKDCIAGVIQINGRSKVDSLRRLSKYPLYSKYIEKFIELFHNPAMKVKMEGVDLIPNWGFEKPSEKVFNVQVLSLHKDISTFFQPVAVKLSKIVRIRIEYGDETLRIEGIPDELVPKWVEFAESRFIDVVVRKTIETQEKYSNERRPKGYISAIIILPRSWQIAKSKKRLFKELKGLVQETILKLGNK